MEVWCRIKKWHFTSHIQLLARCASESNKLKMPFKSNPVLGDVRDVSLQMGSCCKKRSWKKIKVDRSN